MAGFHNGKGYYDPMKFCKSVIEFEKNVVESALETPESAPVTLAPTHSVPEIPTVAVPKEAPVVKAEAPVTAAPEKPILAVGSKGADVKYVQKKLGLTVDGDFGPKTQAAVKEFQTKNGLDATGKVGPKTWAKLG
jgi:hypothetical protein